jgi:hypothetical protein
MKGLYPICLAHVCYKSFYRHESVLGRDEGSVGVVRVIVEVVKSLSVNKSYYLGYVGRV